MSRRPPAKRTSKKRTRGGAKASKGKPTRGKRDAAREVAPQTRRTPVRPPRSEQLARAPGLPSTIAPTVRSAERLTGAALERLELLETLEHGWEIWDELRAAHAAFVARCEEERRKIDHQGAFLVGAVRAAAQGGAASPNATALAARSDEPLQALLAEAEAKIARARASLERDLAGETAVYDAAFRRLRDALFDRVQRMLAGAPPRLRLLLRPVGRTGTLLHLERVSGDDAVLLLHALTGTIPSRYGFLFDDSTDDVTLPPAPLYPDEGLLPSQTRPEPAALRDYLSRPAQVLAVKGFVPVFVPRPDGDTELFRLLQRGPVMEVELLRDGAFTSILAREEGERLAGHLLRLKLAGTIRLELEAG